MIGRRIPRVKVCCIAGIEEARVAFEAGVDAIGLVSAMPSGPGVIAEATVAEVAAAAPARVATFLLTSLIDVDAIVAQQRRCGTTTIQICDRLSEAALLELRERIPEVAIVAVVHVNGREALDEALRIAPYVDALLLDSGNPDAAVKQLGGTGRAHDWALSAEIRAKVAVPLFLAGGLSADNVRHAIDQVEPWGVDVCSGLRTQGRLDRDKLLAFLSACGRPL